LLFSINFSACLLTLLSAFNLNEKHFMSVDKMHIEEMTLRTFKVNIINQNLSGANCHRTKQAELEKLFRGSTDLIEVELKLLSHVIENTDDVKKIRLYCTVIPI
jgi:hypothetical protein